MNTESREHLSSFMDGEVSHDSARFLVRRLAADGGLRETWVRYHLIRDCLRQQDGDFVSHELRDRVQGALADEPAHVAGGRRDGWMRSAVGVAIAASVALAAVLAVGPDSVPGPQPAGEVVSQQPSAEPFVSPNIRTMTPQSQPVNLSGSESAENPEINAYLLRHYQVTGGAGGRGFVSFVPIVITHSLPAKLPAAEADTVDETLREEDPARQ
jgi:sigma-E factor negative regulatory protein RseA